MLGERSDQRGLWEADQLYLDLVGRDTFYGLLASQRGQLFRRVVLPGQWSCQRSAQPAGHGVAVAGPRQSERC